VVVVVTGLRMYPGQVARGGSRGPTTTLPRPSIAPSWYSKQPTGRARNSNQNTSWIVVTQRSNGVWAVGTLLAETLPESR